jgi:hypothetical protein
MRSRQFLFSWVDEGAGDLNYFGRRRYNKFVSKHGLSKQWRGRLANPRILNSPLQTTFWLIPICFKSTPSVPKNMRLWVTCQSNYYNFDQVYSKKILAFMS